MSWGRFVEFSRIAKCAVYMGLTSLLDLNFKKEKKLNVWFFLPYFSFPSYWKHYIKHQMPAIKIRSSCCRILYIYLYKNMIVELRLSCIRFIWINLFFQRKTNIPQIHQGGNREQTKLRVKENTYQEDKWWNGFRR